MGRRVIALLLCVVLLLAAVPVGASAKEDQPLRNQIIKTYRRALAAAGVESFAGYCGLMAGYQLWAMGITYSPEIYDGKNMFDAHAKAEQTSGGYPITAYAASEYTLEEALYAATCVGTKDVYNLMVGFQYTNTTAGAQYGHALVLHAIVGGTVYFVESFYLGAPVGTVLTMSIPEFCHSYNSWTVFDGLIVFGDGSCAERSEIYATDVMVRATEDTVLYDQPDAQASSLRKVSQGEVFRGVAVYENEEGGYYYRLSTGGYLACDAANVLRTDRAEVSVTALQISDSGAVSGRVCTVNPILKNLHLTVVDASGNILGEENREVRGCVAELGSLSFGKLPTEGQYTVKLNADVILYYLSDGELVSQESSVQLSSTEYSWQDAVCVGSTPGDAPVRDGWVAENGTLYYYQDGKCRVGWYCDDGADYYFNEDGSVTTGWAMINGRYRYFTETGVLWTGWLETEQGTYYMLSNGVAALGERQIDGILYNFGEDGILQTENAETAE